MKSFSTEDVIGVIGAGAMGSGIAQVAATAGHHVLVNDAHQPSLDGLKPKLEKIFNRLVEKGRQTEEESKAILGRIELVSDISAMAPCSFVIEAIIEDVSVKQNLFSGLEEVLPEDAVLATNTSSLAVSEIAAACKQSGRVIGVHFFNPAPLMPLVEIIPGLMTADDVVPSVRALVDSWKKVTVLAKDTPGFIVNRIARPFYGEALRQFEEGVAEPQTIDWAMKELGGFRMGPFELMDLIGHDINNKVSETVFEAFYYDQRYKPSIYQKRMVQAGMLGRKTKRGFYDYADGVEKPEPNEDKALGEKILNRIVCMLINEAVDALFLKIASKEDIDLAMTKGVNYPKGLLAWADELGLAHVLSTLENLQSEYGEDRYRPSPLLKRMVADNQTFF